MGIRLFGRRAEIAVADAAIEAARDGRRTLIVVSGGAGSGKEQLLAVVAERARDAGLEVRSTTAYKASRSEAGRVADQLGLEGLSTDPGPTALTIADAQWADPTSIGLMQRVLATSREGLLVVISQRPVGGHESLPLRELEKAVGRNAAVEHLNLTPLTTADIEEAAAADVAERMLELTGGRYQDVERLVTEWLEQGVIEDRDGRLTAVAQLPDSWPGAQAVQLSTLDPLERDLAEAAVIAGRPIPLEVAATLLGASVDDTLVIGERLSDRGVLAQTREGFSPATSDLAEQIDDTLGEVRKGRVYRNLGDAFSAYGLAEHSPGVVGTYYVEGDSWELGIPLLDSAVTRALESGSLAEAVPFIDAALDALAATDADDPEMEGQLRLARARFYQVAGWTDLAADDLRVATRILEGASRVDALGFLAAIEDDEQHIQTASTVVALAIWEAESIGESGKVGSLLILQARILNRLGFPIEADASLARGTAILDAEGNPYQRFLASYNSARIDLDRGYVARSEPVFRRLTDSAAETGDLASKADMSAWLSRAQLRGAHAAEGIVSADMAARLGDETGTFGPVFLGYMALAEGASRYGQFGVALDAADNMLGFVLRQLPAWENAARYLRARALLGLGRVEDASREIAEAIGLCPAGVDGWRWRLRCEALQLAVVAQEDGEWPKERAEDLTDELLQGHWFDAAAELKALRSGMEDDPDLARQSAALALQLGSPTIAAAAIEAVDIWSDPAAIAVGVRVREAAGHVPKDWYESWSRRPEIAAALALPEVEDEEYQAAATALQADLDDALDAAGLTGASVLSPAQRRERGLVRRKPGRVRRAMVWTVAAAAVIVLGIAGGALALTLFGPEDPPEAAPPATTIAATTTVPRIEATKIDPPEGFAGFTGDWITLGASTCRMGTSDATGVVEPTGYYWRNDDAGGEYSSSPIVLRQKVVIGQGRNVYFIDRRTGKATASSPTSAEILATIEGAELLEGQKKNESTFFAYVVTDGPDLYAFEAGTGRKRWQYAINPSGTPAVGADELYVGTTEGYVAALDPFQNDADDELLWRWPLSDAEPIGPITTDMTLSGNDLYFASGSDLYIVDVETHQGKRCEVTTVGEFATPVVAGDRVYASNTDGFIHVIEAGTCEWETQIFVGGELTTRPVVADGLVIQVIGTGFVTYEVGIWDAVHGWPAAGSEEFANATFNTAPSVAGGIAYIGGSDGSVYAVDLAEGETIWVWDEEGAAITSTPTVTDGVVYVATRDGEVVAIGGEPGVSSPIQTCLRSDGEAEGTSKSGGDRLE